MKRVISLLIIFIVIILLFFQSNKNLVNALASSKINYSLSSVVENENGVMVFIDGIDYKDVISALEIEIVTKNEIADRLVIEGYTRKINNYICIDNHKINIQFSITENDIIIGSPLIYGSF